MKIATILLLLILSSSSFSQCTVTVTPEIASSCTTANVTFEATAIYSGVNITSVDFNSNSLPSGWLIGGATTFTQPCGLSLSMDNYYWSSSASGVPFVQTDSIDVLCGGEIVFDMVYGVQFDPTPCDGPDYENEGVSLQYSLNGGATWGDIIYFSPLGYTLPSNPGSSGSSIVGPTPYTSWNTFSVPVPQTALSVNTMFRWLQTNSSGAPYDNWGLDNIIIQTGDCSNSIYNWSNGALDTSSISISSAVDSFYVVSVYDSLGVLQCQDTGYVVINPSSIVYVVTESCDSLEWNGTVYYNSGMFSQVLQNAFGCDSTVTMDLTIIPSSIVSSILSVCDSVDWNGTVYYNSGQYAQVFLNSLGCDSTVIMDLTILPPLFGSFSIDACDSSVWNGTVYNNSGQYTQVLTSSLGCDSTVTLDLTIHHDTVSNINVSGTDSVVVNGISYTSSGVYQQTLTSVFGCDSTINIDVTLNYTGLLDVEKSPFKCIPNPAQEIFTIQSNEKPNRVEVMDLSGRIMITIVHPQTLTIDASQLNNGTYIVTVFCAGATYSERVMVEH